MYLVEAHIINLSLKEANQVMNQVSLQSLLTVICDFKGKLQKHHLGQQLCIYRLGFELAYLLFEFGDHICDQGEHSVGLEQSIPGELPA
jgi:hypothetical protein